MVSDGSRNNVKENSGGNCNALQLCFAMKSKYFPHSPHHACSKACTPSHADVYMLFCFDISLNVSMEKLIVNPLMYLDM